MAHPILDATRTMVRNRAQDMKPVPAFGITPGAWPVGSIFFSAVPTDPNILLGFGVWQLFAEGRVLVGISAVDPEFDTLLELYGEKTHVLTVPETPCACP